MFKDDEFEFATDVRAALIERPPRFAWILTLTVLLALVGGVAWASWAVVEETTAGAGRVIPSRQLQVVQSLEAGLVRDILVKEGDVVEEGDILVNIDDTGVSSRLGELTQRHYAFQAEIARLEAEAGEAETLGVPAALETAAPQSVEAERAAFRARRQQLAEELAVLDQQHRQRKQEIEELNVRERKVVEALVPLERELELTRDLFDRKVIPEIEFLRLERQVAENRGELDVIRASMPRVATAAEEALGMIANRRANYRAEAQEKLAKTRSDLAVIEETLRAARDQVVRTALRAPVRGVVNKINLNTIGAVLQPGQSIVEIVPIDDALLIEAQIRPQDVAFIRPDQAASVKLSAYDYRVYGTLAGQVERISADTIANREGETFYRVIVRTDKNHLIEGEQKLPIIPGMVATVDIQTGEKTVLDYLLNPIVRIRHEAFRER